MKNLLIVVHPDREEAISLGSKLAKIAIDKGFTVYSNRPDLLPNVVEYRTDLDLVGVVVFGGDGTILRAAEIAHGTNAPIIGINMGKVGFLAEISNPTLEEIINSIETGEVVVEPRLTIAYKIIRGEKEISNGWALNEVVVERSETSMLELFVQIDNRPLSRWGCDAVICSTPTGSTAYAFSAGGPLVWPEVDAMVLLPLAAHALFSDPMVVSPNSTVVIDIESEKAEISADGIRKVKLIEGDRVVITKDPWRVKLAHIDQSVFTDRLVAKFKLPIEGWRGERKK
jgi:NAD+ kinase